MTTTTSTTSSTSTTSTTTTKSSSSVISSAATTLLSSLDTGSGVDTTSLVSSLVEAQYSGKTTALSTKADALTAEISGVSTVKSAITTFATALQTLVKGGTLQTQPVSSNSNVLTATALTGAKLAGLSSSVTVSQLADKQTAVSKTSVASSSTTIGSGTLTLTLGSATYNSDGSMASFTAGSSAATSISITDGSLTSIAKSINDAKTGVTASVVTDANGAAYLSLKGATGADQAFTLSSTSTSGDLSSLDVGVGKTNTKLTSTAQDAKLTVDGVSVTRSSNTISDLIDGVKLSLTGTSTSPVTLTSDTPTSALSGAVSDFVDAYNEVIGILTTQTDAITGPLKSDTAAKALLTSLRGMTTTALTSGGDTGSPTTLAELGVGTNKDGTLTLNTDTLSTQLTKFPQAVENMFAYSALSTTGLSSILSSLSSEATNTVYGLGASATNYAQQQSDLSDQQTALDDAKTAMNTRLTAQFASMSTKVSAYKSVQTFLTNQIAQWNKSDS